MEIKKGMRFKCIRDVFSYGSKEPVFIKGKTYTSEEDDCITNEDGHIRHMWGDICGYFEPLEDDKPESPQRHYDNTNGSLYHLASRLDLNHWEFDILKRLVRCRKKGQFEQDLKKIKDTVDIYLQEYK